MTPAETPQSTDPDTALAARLSEFARTIQQSDEPHAALENIVHAAVELIPGCEAGSISAVVGRQRLESQAPSAELPRVVDALQEEAGEGPCLDAAYEHVTVRVPDMATETRWPRFAARAAAAGAASMLSFQLYVEGDNLGALNLYATTAGAFTEESEHVGLLFASHAAIAYAAVQQMSGLVRKVETRQLIGQAQGILMERHKIDSLQAFEHLVRASQQSNTKLREVADRLIYSGSLES